MLKETTTLVAILAAIVLTVIVAPTMTSLVQAAPSGAVSTFSGKTFVLSITLPNDTKVIRGPPGPQGLQGLQGPQGIQGPQGVPGKNGTLQVCVQNETGFCP